MRSENFLLLAITAQKFACRPSQLVGLHDPVLALDFDLAAAARLLAHEHAALAACERVAPGFSPASSPRSGREEQW